MFHNRRFTFAAVTAPLAFIFTAFSSVHAAHDAYGKKELNFKEITSDKNGEVDITFTAKPESLYFCPGANAKTTKEGIELTFVRSSIKKKPKVKYPAKPAKKGKVITVTAKDKPVFLRDGKKLVQLFPKD